MSLPVLAITSCDGCSACCRGRIMPPFGAQDEAEFQSLPANLRMELESLLSSHPAPEDTSACVWLDLNTNLCRHYDHRPEACREFERSSYYCHFQRRKWLVSGIPQSEPPPVPDSDAG